jgi:hypothetical protein
VVRLRIGQDNVGIEFEEPCRVAYQTSSMLELADLARGVYSQATP